MAALLQRAVFAPLLIVLGFGAASLAGCGRTASKEVAASSALNAASDLSTANETANSDTGRPNLNGASSSLELATFGSGCFWCSEAIFENLQGVQKVESGYSGGHVKDPTYQAVCAGVTGHAEVIQATYDPAEISYAELLEVFWGTHDPTTLNQQGGDFGTQYRSVIYFHNESQRELAETYKKKLDAAGAFNAPIVTEISPFTKFYVAEVDHQDFYARNSRNRYCQMVIAPKLEKLKKVFKDKLKTSE